MHGEALQPISLCPRQLIPLLHLSFKMHLYTIQCIVHCKVHYDALYRILIPLLHLSSKMHLYSALKGTLRCTIQNTQHSIITPLIQNAPVYITVYSALQVHYNVLYRTLYKIPIPLLHLSLKMHLAMHLATVPNQCTAQDTNFAITPLS